MASRRALGRRIVGLITIAVIRIMAALPMPVGRAITRVVGRTALLFVPRLKKIGMENLDRAYGDSITRAEKKKILGEAMDNICAVAAELPKIPQVAAEGIENYVELRGLENVDRSRGGLLISGHFGNWEWMPSVMAGADLHVLTVIRELDDPALNTEIRRLRSGERISFVHKDEAAGPIVAHMLEGHMGGIMADQCPRENAVPTTFFGAPCWSTIGPALVAMRAGLPIYPVEIMRTAPGKYIGQIHPPVEIQNTGDTMDDLVVNAQRCQDVIEAWVRKRPGQWLWFHRRWKKRPKLEAEWAERLEKKRQKALAQEATSG